VAKATTFCIILNLWRGPMLLAKQQLRYTVHRTLSLFIRIDGLSFGKRYNNVSELLGKMQHDFR
jgi:hypothetical protein